MCECLTRQATPRSHTETDSRNRRIIRRHQICNAAILTIRTNHCNKICACRITELMNLIKNSVPSAGERVEIRSKADFGVWNFCVENDPNAWRNVAIGIRSIRTCFCKIHKRCKRSHSASLFTRCGGGDHQDIDRWSVDTSSGNSTFSLNIQTIFKKFFRSFDCSRAVLHRFGRKYFKLQRLSSDAASSPADSRSINKCCGKKSTALDNDCLNRSISIVASQNAGPSADGTLGHFGRCEVNCPRPLSLKTIPPGSNLRC